MEKEECVMRFLGKLQGVHQAGPNQWRARCPAHKDEKASLSIKLDTDRILLHCFAGCSPEAIVNALGLELRDLFLEPDRSHRKQKTKGKTYVWQIRDLGGNLIAEHIRVDTPDGKRLWWRRNGKKGLGGLSTKELPLYGIEMLKDLSDNTTVVVTEGEKAADAVRAAGIPAVGTVCGASVTPAREALKLLKRFDVVLWPDADPQGKQHMERIAQELMALGIKPRWVEWADAPLKGDAADAGPETIQQLVNEARLRASPQGTPAKSLTTARATVAKWLDLPDLNVVDVTLAVVLANQGPGDPVWLMFIGPSSSAKSEILRALPVGDGNSCVFISSLTAKTLISGHKDAGGGLLFRVSSGQTLVMSDFGQVLSLHPNDKAQVLQRLREVHDGYTRADYGNRADPLKWRGKLGFLCGATPAIERYTSVGAELGDRFLYYAVTVLDRENQGVSALKITGQEQQMREELAEAFAEALAAALNPTAVELSLEARDVIVHLADLTTMLRTPVGRNRYDKTIQYIPQAEGPARFAKELALLAKALAAVRGKTAVTADEYPVLAHIALSSIPSKRVQVFAALCELGEGSTKRVALAANMPTTSTGYILEDLQLLGAVNRYVSPGMEDKQTATFFWSPEERQLALWRELLELYTQKQQTEIREIYKAREDMPPPVFECEASSTPKESSPNEPDPDAWPTCRGCGRKVPRVDGRGLCPDCQAVEVEAND